MGDRDKVLAEAPSGLKMTPRAWEGWLGGGGRRRVTCYCIYSAYLRGWAEPSRVDALERLEGELQGVLVS